jgi:ABC-type Fe3+ transport system permease subunit
MESVKELDLSLTLQPFGYSSPALKIYAFSRNQNMDRAAVWVLSAGVMAAPLRCCGGACGASTGARRG